jgi:hypothetical protein
VLQDSVVRWRVQAVVSGQYLVADFRNFYSYETAAVPRLIDDVWRFTQWREREYIKLQADLNRFAAHADWEREHLWLDLARYKQEQLDQIPKLMLEVNDFFATYEREVRPLSEDVKRWWRYQIACRRLLMKDLRNFYTHSKEETAELEEDMTRFVAYGSVEWAELKIRIKRFATCDYDPAFGDGALPNPVERPTPPFDDYMPPATVSSDH